MQEAVEQVAAGRTPAQALSPMIETVARVAHETNRAYCQTLGDYSQKTFETADDEIRKSAIAGVRAILDGVVTTPVQSHQAWAAAKEKAGWKYGASKDLAAKIHPNLMPFGDLPVAQQTKDFLFFNVVQSFIQALA